MTPSSRSSAPNRRFHSKNRPESDRVSKDRQHLKVKRLGDRTGILQDLYHQTLTTPFYQLLAWITLFYLALNCVFAWIYMLDPTGIEGSDGSFLSSFFFSVQTIATVGYGAMYPKTPFTQVVAAIEALIGLLGLSMGTGLMFAHFSRPTSHVLFSRPVSLSTHNGRRTLMFRMANRRNSHIIEAQVQVALIRDEITHEGTVMRRFHNLRLARSQSPLFALSWTVMHPITPESPLFGLSMKDMEDTDTMLVISLTGVDDTLGQTIHARHIYLVGDIEDGMRFSDIMSVEKDGRRVINFSYFHDLEPEKNAQYRERKAISRAKSKYFRRGNLRRHRK
ncbi:MAG: ion channel [Cyanophyceae cyanobacterium]